MAEAAGIDLPWAVDGVSLDRAADDRVLLTEGTRYGYEKKAAYGRADGERWKLVVSRGDGVDVGFTLPEDTPQELPEPVAARLRAAFPDWPDGGSVGRGTAQSVERRLERLGYR